MKLIETSLDAVLIVEPVFLGDGCAFVQNSHSCRQKGLLRGLLAQPGVFEHSVLCN